MEKSYRMRSVFTCDSLDAVNKWVGIIDPNIIPRDGCVPTGWSFCGDSVFININPTFSV